MITDTPPVRVRPRERASVRSERLAAQVIYSDGHITEIDLRSISHVEAPVAVADPVFPPVHEIDLRNRRNVDIETLEPRKLRPLRYVGDIPRCTGPSRLRPALLGAGPPWASDLVAAGGAGAAR